ncbi:MAG: YdiU family protein [Planctomycetes bacterium]|nr:YdiU family protein [Planctomycetota bacterium]MCB9884002.1 YdiU family protein [Planctomycetota bacterium]
MQLPEFRREFRDQLPGDPSDVLEPRQVEGALWSPVASTPVAAPRLLAHSAELAADLGLSPEVMRDASSAAVLGGNALWPGMRPYAANYGGHQFGHWAGQLGDGRAIVLGELVTPDGTTQELQLKGAGPTPYSRRGDGRAVLRSSLREFLCSEAMFHLGVPTTRALSLVATGDQVVRDMFYDGNAAAEPGAIVCRVAPSFLRFGSYELPASRGDTALLRQLVDFTLLRHFPELGAPSPATYAALLREVAERTARLVAAWMRVGFVHGVLNTDNMSILGLTIDYGPYGWIDDFDPAWTPNTTDLPGRRYCFGNQPQIGLWNVERLGAALLPLLEGDAPVAAALQAYQQTYGEAATAGFAARLGLTFDAARGDGELLAQCFEVLGGHETDMTIFFRALTDVAEDTEPSALPPALAAAFYTPPDEQHLARVLVWLRRWWQRTRGEPALAPRLREANPKFVLRNWLAQEAIDAAHAGDLQPLHTLQEVMRRPFDEQPGREHYAQRRPDWARDKPGCSALSCSS